MSSLILHTKNSSCPPIDLVANATHKYRNSNVVRRAGTVRGSLSVRKTARREAVPQTH